MARVKLIIPQQSIASVQIPVRITDINYGNHMGNDSLVSIIHEARVQWLAKYNYTELNIDGTGLIMSDLAVEYRAEVFYGDTLTVNISATEISSIGFELYYHIFNQHNKEIAKAKTGMVCYNYEVKKVAAVPAGLIRILQAV
ncbi:MAG: thioesterase [Sphingobacteriales bacterium]|nr:MAG: thioesterase [Sphingobacteriales bacterium]